ncbi:MAG: ABC transporter substrate-binding protein [Blastocatellia bacterium]
MTQPLASVESFLNTFRPLPRHKLEAVYTKGEFSKAWDITTPPAELAVLGAFVVKEFVPNQRTILARNPNFWKKDKAGNALPYLDEIVIEAVPDANTSLLKFQQGEVDLMDNIAPANFATLKQQTPANVTAS